MVVSFCTWQENTHMVIHLEECQVDNETASLYRRILAFDQYN